MPRYQTGRIFLLLVIAAIGMTLVYTVRVLAQPATSTRLEAQQAWSMASDVPGSMEVLSPVWLPPAFRHHPQVGSERWGPGADSGYEVAYCAADCFSPQPTSLDFALNPFPGRRRPDSVFRLKVRGTTGSFAIYRSQPTYEISWREAGQRYAVFGNKVWPSDLLKVAARLRSTGRTP